MSHIQNPSHILLLWGIIFFSFFKNADSNGIIERRWIIQFLGSVCEPQVSLSCLDEIRRFWCQSTCIGTGSAKIRREILFPSIYPVIFGVGIRALERRNSDCGTISTAQMSENGAATGVNGSETSKIWPSPNFVNQGNWGTLPKITGDVINNTEVQLWRSVLPKS